MQTNDVNSYKGSQQNYNFTQPNQQITSLSNPYEYSNPNYNIQPNTGLQYPASSPNNFPINSK